MYLYETLQGQRKLTPSWAAGSSAKKALLGATQLSQAAIRSVIRAIRFSRDSEFRRARSVGFTSTKAESSSSRDTQLGPIPSNHMPMRVNWIDRM